MPHQYFEDNTNLPSNIQKITFSIKGKKIDFLTDNGVFSKTYLTLVADMEQLDYQLQNYILILRSIW